MRRLASPLWAVIALAGVLTVLSVAERQIKEEGQRIKLKRVSALPPFTPLSLLFSSLLSFDVCCDITNHLFDFGTFFRLHFTFWCMSRLSTHDGCHWISWNNNRQHNCNSPFDYLSHLPSLYLHLSSECLLLSFPLLLGFFVIPVIFNSRVSWYRGHRSSSTVDIHRYLLRGSVRGLQTLISCLVPCLSIGLIGPLIFSFSHLPFSQIHRT